MSAEYPPKDELKNRRQGPDKALLSSGPVRQIETGPMAHRPAASRTETRGRRIMSAFVLRLARRLERDPDELASEMTEDTIRRTKYAVVEEVMDDGTILYKHNPVR